VLEQLASGDRAVAELTAGLDISKAAVSRHLRVLREAGDGSDHRAPCTWLGRPRQRPADRRDGRDAARVAALTAIPARIRGRHPVAEILQAETA
jgi:predicted ArsR family transcriptional regulator